MLFTDDEFSSRCDSYFLIILYKQLLVILISMALFLINEIIEFILVKLAKFTKHKYLTSLNGEMTIKIFMIMYLNTGIIMSIADLEIPFLPSSMTSGSKKHKDTAKDWYVQAGDSFIAILIINIMAYCLVNLFKVILNKINICMCKKRYVLHQYIVKLYEGVELDLPLNYARTLTVLFV